MKAIENVREKANQGITGKNQSLTAMERLSSPFSYSSRCWERHKWRRHKAA